MIRVNLKWTKVRVICHCQPIPKSLAKKKCWTVVNVETQRRYLERQPEWFHIFCVTHPCVTPVPLLCVAFACRNGMLVDNLDGISENEFGYLKMHQGHCPRHPFIGAELTGRLRLGKVWLIPSLSGSNYYHNVQHMHLNVKPCYSSSYIVYPS